MIYTTGTVRHKFTRYEKWLDFENDKPDFILYLTEMKIGVKNFSKKL